MPERGTIESRDLPLLHLDGSIRAIDGSIRLLDESIRSIDGLIGAINESIGVIEQLNGAINESIGTIDGAIRSLDRRGFQDLCGLGGSHINWKVSFRVACSDKRF